ncbi:Uncharacterized protein MCB1EB_0940 [Mycoavidus cysteinexigens]|uniref:Uncharacterized protein n=1 Tax=Mycoavidus cysteinexigens TaxID=1553431 RepID=A0A2Z6EUJ9_9BURK|nr:Uncharacterized protein MCB1EB_0940 [Mycoavidus cysteinexigens]GAM52158.1 hypothetical protein EBME_0621 [bacterium endosymbiont of Mortierella elongata FMR23-6]GLR00234.1 hypothetical protein GCM10007934_00450 [Mycoavidus cysteinexigens]
MVQHNRILFAAKLDREPAGISLTELAEINAYNASVCWQWRKQALGLKAFYKELLRVGTIGDSGSRIIR